MNIVTYLQYVHIDTFRELLDSIQDNVPFHNIVNMNYSNFYLLMRRLKYDGYADEGGDGFVIASKSTIITAWNESVNNLRI